MRSTIPDMSFECIFDCIETISMAPESFSNTEGLVQLLIDVHHNLDDLADINLHGFHDDALAVQLIL